MGSNRVKTNCICSGFQGGAKGPRVNSNEFPLGCQKGPMFTKESSSCCLGNRSSFFAFSSFLLIITATALMDLFPARLVFYKFQLELLLNAMTWIYSFAVANL